MHICLCACLRAAPGSCLAQQQSACWAPVGCPNEPLLPTWLAMSTTLCTASASMALHTHYTHHDRTYAFSHCSLSGTFSLVRGSRINFLHPCCCWRSVSCQAAYQSTLHMAAASSCLQYMHPLTGPLPPAPTPRHATSHTFTSPVCGVVRHATHSHAPHLLLLMKNTASLAAKMRALALMAVSTACSSPSGPSSSTGAGPCDGLEAVKPAAAAAAGGLSRR